MENITQSFPKLWNKVNIVGYENDYYLATAAALNVAHALAGILLMIGSKPQCECLRCLHYCCLLLVAGFIPTNIALHLAHMYVEWDYVQWGLRFDDLYRHLEVDCDFWATGNEARRGVEAI